MPQGTTLYETEMLTRELDELDRVLHRVRTQLQGLPKKKSQLEHWGGVREALTPRLTVAELWSALRTLGTSPTLHAKLPGDPVAWQRTLRSESDRHRTKLLTPYRKSLRTYRP